MIAMVVGSYCPGCRARKLREYAALLDESIQPYLFPQEKFDPRVNPDAGQEVMNAMALGIPMNVGQAMKPSKFFFEQAGNEPPKKKRKSTKSGKARRKSMSKNLKIVNARARKKNGDLKKGWTQARIMKTAHRMTRKDCK